MSIVQKLFFTSYCLLLLNSCQPLPHTWALLDGSSFDPKTFNGDYIFLNYWAIWCKPCLTEMPELAKFAATHPHTVKVLAINYDAIDAVALRQQSAKVGIELALLLADPAPHYQWPTQAVLPYTLIIDRQLAIVDTLIGPQTLASLNQWLQQRQ